MSRAKEAGWEDLLPGQREEPLISPACGGHIPARRGKIAEMMGSSVMNEDEGNVHVHPKIWREKLNVPAHNTLCWSILQIKFCIKSRFDYESLMSECCFLLL